MEKTGLSPIKPQAQSETIHVYACGCGNQVFYLSIDGRTICAKCEAVSRIRCVDKAKGLH